MDPKPNSWKHKEGAPAIEEKAHIVEEEGVVEEQQDQNQASDNSKWESHQEKAQEKQALWGPKGATIEGDVARKGEGNSHNIAGSSHNAPLNQKFACEKCGLSNHSTKECRRFACEIGGLSNHSTYDCKKCLPWNFGPELCATQVED
jgi:hypothetical protein